MSISTQDKESLFPEANLKFASFWNRVGASLLDGLIISAVILPITYFNVTRWKIPYLFILTTAAEVIYKPFMEYRYEATIGKMAVGIRVLGHEFQRVSLNEEMKRVSFYLIPSILQFMLTVHVYFSPAFLSIGNYTEYNNFIVNTNPGTLILGGIVFVLGVADCIVFFMNPQRRALHDLYAGTYVVEN